MSVSLSPIFNGWQGFSIGGLPLAGGLLKTYLAGTSTFAGTYTDNTGLVLNPTTIQLDGAGLPPNEIWLTDGVAYKFVLTDSLGLSPRTYDNITGIGYSVLAALLAASTGSSLVGFTQGGASSVTRTLQAHGRDWPSVKDYGAVGDGTTDDTVAIQAAMDASDSVWFPFGTYITSSTLRASRVIAIDCAVGTTIKATSGTFNGTSITKAGGAFTLKALIAVFSGTNIGSQTDVRLGETGNRVFIGPLQLDCNNKADYGVLLNCTPGAHVKAKVAKALDFGIWAGTFCWGCHFDHIRVMDAVNGCLFIGEGSNGCHVDTPEFWGDGITTAVGLYVNSTTHGTIGYTGQVIVSGGYIEKCVKGVYLKNTGHVQIDSVDIEGITGNAVHADLDSGNTYGQCSIIDCNLSSLGAAIKNTNALILVQGGTITDGGTTEPYLSDTNDSLFVVRDVHQYNSSGLPTVDPLLTTTNTIQFDTTTKNKRRSLNKRLTITGGAYNFVNESYNLTSNGQPQILSSGLAYLSKAIGDGPDTNWSYASLFARITDTNAGTPRSKTEARVNVGFLGAEVKTFWPETDNDTNLGAAAQRFQTVYAGTGAINTSDANQKQQIRALDDREMAAAKEMRTLIRAFRFNDSVAAKGDSARIHFGVIAQDVRDVFLKHGLDADQYGVFCRDVLDNGEERLGVRYDELLALMLATL